MDAPATAAKIRMACEDHLIKKVGNLRIRFLLYDHTFLFVVGRSQRRNFCAMEYNTMNLFLFDLFDFTSLNIQFKTIIIFLKTIDSFFLVFYSTKSQYFSNSLIFTSAVSRRDRKIMAAKNK